LTGANAVSADGAIFIVENEGNISLVSKIPSKHIIVTGIDKIVPTTQDAMLVCQAAAVWGTGSLPAYINVITSPSKTSDIRGKTVWGAQATREVHLIFVDNGRSQVIAQGFEQLLWCIGCGACLYLCPIYDQILNHYGSLYLGGRGIGMCVFQENMQQAFEKGLYFCTTCQACKTNCPLELDIPQLLKQLRVRAINYKLETPTNQEMLRCIRRAGNPFGRLKPSEIPKKLFCC
jgi:L-lactate dehydrogenase complex protein LldG